jgi:hypothetical protein
MTDRVAGTDLDLAHYDSAGLDFGSRADKHRPVNHNVRPDLHIGFQMSARVNDGGRMNHGTKSLPDKKMHAHFSPMQAKIRP